MKAWVLLIFCVWYAFPVCVRAQILPTVNQVVAAWEAREHSVRTLQIKWDATVTISEEYLRTIPVSGRDKNSNERKVVPNDLLKVKMSAFIDDVGRVRLDYCSPTWSSQKKEFVLQPKTQLFDNRAVIRFHEKGLADFPSALIEKGRGQDVSNSFDAIPLRLIYRPTTSETLIDMQDLIDRAKIRALPNNDHILLETPTIEITVDKSRDYLPLQYIRRNRGDMIRRATIEYIEDAKSQVGRWRPTKWTVAAYDRSGKPRKTMGGNVTECLLNARIGDEVFRIDFPVGTYVRDKIKDQMYFIRHADVRPIVRGEFNGANYQTLITSEPKPVGFVSRLTARVMAIVLNIIVLMVLVVLFVRRYMIRRASI